MRRNEILTLGLALFMMIQGLCLIWTWTIPGANEHMMEAGNELGLWVMFLYVAISSLLASYFFTFVFVKRYVQDRLNEWEVYDD